jgi:hypothetical protein
VGLHQCPSERNGDGIARRGRSPGPFFVGMRLIPPMCGSKLTDGGLEAFPATNRSVPVRSLRVPSHVPSHPQTAAKGRGRFAYNLRVHC